MYVCTWYSYTYTKFLHLKIYPLYRPYLYSASGEYLLTGSSNGCVRLHPLSTPHTLRDLSSYWSVNMHDNHYGAVTCLCSSFDDQYVISGGNDGNLFVYKANLPTAAQRAKAILLQVGENFQLNAPVVLNP